MSLRPYWKRSDANFVIMEVKGQSRSLSITLPGYLAAMRYPNSIHNFIKFCLEHKMPYDINSENIETIMFPETNFDTNTKNMISFVDARDKIKERIINNQVIPFHEPWMLRQLSPEQRYEYGYIGLKDGRNIQSIMPRNINPSLRTREDKEWEKIHNSTYICNVVKRAINQTYWNDGDENVIKMDIRFSSNIVFSPTFPQIIVACEYPYLYFEYIQDYSQGKEIGYSTYLEKALVYGYLIHDKCKIYPKGKISYFEPIDSLDDFENLKFADRMNFLATEAYSKWLAYEPVPEYKDDIEREKRIKEKELALNDRIKFFEKVIENKSDFTEEALKFEVDKSMFFFTDCTYAGDSVYNEKKENLLNLMKTAFNDPVLHDIMLNSYKELEGKLNDSVKKESTEELKKLKSVGLFLGIEKNQDQSKSKCCYLI